MTRLADTWRRAVAARPALAPPEREITAAPFGSYAGREYEFIRDVLGMTFLEQGRRATEELFRARKVTWRGARKTSKTYTFSGIILAFFYTAPSIVLFLGPTYRTVQNQTWANIREAHAASRSPLPGRCAKQASTGLELSSTYWMKGISTDDPDFIRGFHSRAQTVADPDQDMPPEIAAIRAGEEAARQGARLLIVLDENPAIAREIEAALRGTMMGHNVYVLRGGNPTLTATSDHPFAQSFQADSGFYRIAISHITTSEYPDPCPVDFRGHEGYGEGGRYGMPAWLVDHREIARQERRTGGDNPDPLFYSDVLGQFFPSDASNQLVTEDMLLACEHVVPPRGWGRHIGYDPAREGRDWNVAALWVDGIKRGQHKWRSDDTMRSAEILVGLMHRWSGEPAGSPKALPGERVHIDTIGIGAGVVDRMRQLGYWIDAVHAGGEPKGDWRALCGEMRFKNRRAELHWIARRAFQEQLVSLPRKYVESWEQAQWATYFYDEKDRLQILKKDKIKEEHGGVSPDFWDADQLAFSRATSGGPAMVTQERRRRAGRLMG